MIDDKKSMKEETHMIMVAIKNIHNLLMISSTCNSIIFLLERTYFADIKNVKFVE